MVNDGGSAFPRQETITAHSHGGGFDIENSGGMSLRDYIAAQALVGYLAGRQFHFDTVNNDFYADNAYKLADAMIKARNLKAF